MKRVAETMIFGEILEGINYKERQSVYGIIKNIKNEVALIKSPGGNFLPGGGIEKGESHENCARREFLEETGHGVELDEYLGCGILYGLAPKQNKYLKIIGYFYLAELGEFIAAKTEEKNEMFWVDISMAVETLKLQNQKWAMREYIGMYERRKS